MSKLWSQVKCDSQGLVPAVVQDIHSGDIRMVAWMNEEAFEHTLKTKRATFYSRSRQGLWVKGESSGNAIEVIDVTLDCDHDTIILRTIPHGPSCHTGAQNCFFLRASEGSDELEAIHSIHGSFLGDLEAEISARQASDEGKSYTKYLLSAGTKKIGEKVEEEAGELVQALLEETDERVISESADLLYHVMVGLRARQLDFSAVVAELARRSGVSGHEEKASRKPKSEDESSPS